MPTDITTLYLSLHPHNLERLKLLTGPLSENISFIEKTLNVNIVSRGHDFSITGEPTLTHQAKSLLVALYRHTETHQTLTHRDIHLTLKGIHSGHQQIHATTYRNIQLKPRTPTQKAYLNTIEEHDINFGIGPAGTGKTFLAVACAVSALQSEAVNRIILARPAVEAGESLGFLPGDLAQKIDPYLRPLYDGLHDLLGEAKVNQLIEKGVIEIAPLAYMRGRTLNDAFIILDEGQNATTQQMKMFLTRIGFGSKAVITGDVTQIDLPKHQASGLKEAIKLCQPIDGIGFTFFTSRDVVRHPLVQNIIDAYENDDTRGRSS